MDYVHKRCLDENGLKVAGSYVFLESTSNDYWPGNFLAIYQLTLIVDLSCF